jgi:hypothetical protein
MTRNVEAQATSWLKICVPDRQITALRTCARKLGAGRAVSLCVVTR